jgi:hypothetical protein
VSCVECVRVCVCVCVCGMGVVTSLSLVGQRACHFCAWYAASLVDNPMDSERIDLIQQTRRDMITVTAIQ